jgi:hypothetical protein
MIYKKQLFVEAQRVECRQYFSDIQAVLSNFSLKPPTMFRAPSPQNEAFARVRRESEGFDK